jgi:hypothetical protein
MSYQRITADLRDNIIARLKEQFQPKLDELAELEHQIAEKIYEEMMGPHAVIMASLPEGWLPTYSNVTVQSKESDFRETFKFSHPKRFTATAGSYHRKPSEQLLKLCKQFTEDEQNIKNIKSEAIKEAQRIIGSVTTVNRLVEVWPEIASVIKDIGEDPQPTSQVPAPLLDKLNEVLDLPVVEKQAA